MAGCDKRLRAAVRGISAGPDLSLRPDYIPTVEGWFYCAAHKALFNGEVVGYALGPMITMDLVNHLFLRPSVLNAIRRTHSSE